MLILCRPSAFDLAALAAIQTSTKLVQLLRNPAFVVTAGPPNALRVYEEVGELVDSYGTPPCPMILPTAPLTATRAPRAESRSVTDMEFADEVR